MPENINETLQTILREQARMSEQINGALKRIDEQTKLVESLRDVASSVKVLALEVQQTKEKVNSISDDIDELKSKPAKRWDSAVSLVITAIITGVITFLLTRAGLK